MSLRFRLITSILVVLLVSLAVGGLLAGWTATKSVRTEMQAALAIGEKTLRNGEAARQAPDAEGPGPDRQVHLFDGNRHLRARLLDEAGRVRAVSVPLEPRQPAPGWLVDLVAPSLPAVDVPLDAGGRPGRMVLEADPRNEVAEVWGQLRDGFAALGLFCALSAALVGFVVSRALRPLEDLSAALAVVGSEGFAARLRPAGSPELVRLAEGFNAMMERLGRAERHNRRLHEQLVAVQEEERAELARDLHDEIGPFLFCVAVDAAAIEQAARSGSHAEIPDSAAAIRRSVSHMQGHVRSMLGRLRPASPVEIGLAPALRNLIAFWQARQPGIAFTLGIEVEEDSMEEAAKEVVYRVVQESVTNAVRHGEPGQVEVSVQAGTEGEVVASIADDGVGLSATAVPGFGLAGLRDRLTARGGSLQVVTGPAGRGLQITARLPRLEGAEALQPPAAA
ncbi:histidine kinase [Roseicella sp. DB1501]|uniref:histidine kinase n=1 Tax=Roseicella sp. DB1501 TaxID=2730925 RepID=UPI0014923664|nr:histidine kinase [Roseicella sp. DB1501]NOG70260.1 HAMP domain-containing protein [Roseicella sp. DB1501]